MNETTKHCFSMEMKILVFTSWQVTGLTVGNTVLMIGNVVTNTLVMYILIKTKQIKNITCKLIFMLSLLHLMVSIFAQNSLTAVLYVRNCLFIVAQAAVSVFLTHFSVYIIAMIGMDRYVRIKHWLNFKAIWTTRIVLILTLIGFGLALFQAVIVTIGFLLWKWEIVAPIHLSVDIIIIGITILLQIKTICISNAIFNKTKMVNSEMINKKITKLSIRIILLLCFFTLPYFIVYNIIRPRIIHQSNDNEILIFKFISLITIIFSFGNCSANAVLFLVTNTKARRFMRDIMRL